MKCGFCKLNEYHCTLSGVEYDIPLCRVCLNKLTDTEFKEEVIDLAEKEYKHNG